MIKPGWVLYIPYIYRNIHNSVRYWSTSNVCSFYNKPIGFTIVVYKLYNYEHDIEKYYKGDVYEQIIILFIIMLNIFISLTFKICYF